MGYPVSRLRYFFRACFIIVSLACVTVSLGSCNLAKNQLTFDRSARKDLQDYRDVLSPEPKPLNATSPTAPAPDFQSVVSTPSDLKLPSPLVTVSVNQTVSLRDLMFELAEQAGVDIEMDPQIHGSIIFTAKDRPFNDVIDRICEMAGLRYTYQNDVLRIELDRPYVKDYKIDYMSATRTTTSDISVGISNTSSGDNTSANAGSNTKVENKFDADFWKDLDTGLKQVLAASDSYKALATLDDPVAIVEPPPPPPPVLDASGKPIPDAVPPPSTVPPSLSVSVPVAAPVAPPTGAAAAGTATYSISKQTGVVTVYATERQHKLVQKFMDSYRRQAMTQVLIEAKVLDVQLNDQFATGIEWGTLSQNLTRLIPSANISLPSPGTIDHAVVSGTPVFTANLNLGHGFKPVIDALSFFGTVRALSSPRVLVMNNQTAVVNVANNLVYFDIKATVTPPTDTTGLTITYDSTQKSVPEGVLMTVVPTANVDTGEVILAVRPTVSKKINEVSDPSIALTILSNGGDPASIPDSPVPEMAVKEIDSIVKMQSGQTMVMGGLMQDGNKTGSDAVPIAGDVPFLGALFRNRQDSVQKSELVIFIKASILPGSNVDDQDRRVYKTFGNDTHPLADL